MYSLDNEPWLPPLLRRLESIDDLTEDEIRRLGRVMAQLVFTAWLAMQDADQQSDESAS